MASTPFTPGPIPVSESDQTKNKKPTKKLPTDRIGVPKQIDILRAYAAAGANGTRPATVGEVAEIVKLAAATIDMAHPFLTSIGLLIRSGPGSFSVSSEVTNFLNAYEWDKETASHKLGPALRSSWFGQALLPRITYGPIEEKLAISVLAEACGATPDYEKELRMLLEFMAAGGLIVREGGQVRPRPVTATSSEPIAPPPTKPQEQATQEQPQRDSARLSTSVNSTPGKFNLNIAVEVDMAEFATWRPERIQAFFRGVAEVLAAKADVEKGGTGT